MLPEVIVGNIVDAISFVVEDKDKQDRDNSFHQELRDLVTKHQLHAGWFIWMVDDPNRIDTSDTEVSHGTISVMHFGCKPCGTRSLAVSVVEMDPELRGTFTETMQALSLGKGSVKGD